MQQGKTGCIMTRVRKRGSARGGGHAKLPAMLQHTLPAPPREDDRPGRATKKRPPPGRRNATRTAKTSGGHQPPGKTRTRDDGQQGVAGSVRGNHGPSCRRNDKKRHELTSKSESTGGSAKRKRKAPNPAPPSEKGGPTAHQLGHNKWRCDGKQAP